MLGKPAGEADDCLECFVEILRGRATGARARLQGMISVLDPMHVNRRGERVARHVLARSQRIAAFDGVYNQLDDLEGFAAEAAEGRQLGFDGKSLIHPSQIAAVNQAFAPTDAELEAAQRLIAAATGGAERHGGRMIETLHVEQARGLIAKARL